MKAQRIAWLLAGSLTLAACGGVEGPEATLTVLDNIKNEVEVGGSYAFTVGGSTRVNFYIQPTGGTCDAADGSDAEVTINVPSGVTATPSKLTFTKCHDGNTFNSQPVVFTATASGNHTITTSVVDRSGTYVNASFTLSVNAATPTNTPPTVSVTGVKDMASYEFGFVPAAGCSVIDPEDGNSTPAAKLSAIDGPLASYGLGKQTASCTYTDAGGQTASASAVYAIVDTGAPTISDDKKPTGDLGKDGWYTSAVTNIFSASDTGAGFEAPLANPHTFDKSSGTEGSAVIIKSGTVSDVAGNIAASIDSAAFKIDLSNPTVTCGATPQRLRSAKATLWSTQP